MASHEDGVDLVEYCGRMIAARENLQSEWSDIALEAAKNDATIWNELMRRKYGIICHMAAQCAARPAYRSEYPIMALRACIMLEPDKEEHVPQESNISRLGRFVRSLF